MTLRFCHKCWSCGRCDRSGRWVMSPSRAWGTSFGARECALSVTHVPGPYRLAKGGCEFSAASGPGEPPRRPACG